MTAPADPDPAPDSGALPDDEPLPGDDAAAAEMEAAPRPRKRAPSMGQSIGGVLFGFEQQVWRNVPPPHELVHHARADDPLPAGDGGFMTLQMPESLGPVSSPTAAGRPEPGVRVLPGQATIAMRIREPMATVDVEALVGRALPAVAARIEASGLVVDGPPYVRYHDWGDETADLEIGFPVGGSAAVISVLPEASAGGSPGRSLLPGGPCAVLVHVGPYQDLPASWGRLMTWMWDRDLPPSGPMWESYVDNPDLVDPAALRTEVLRPIRG
ncbi:MAG TPA: GyrI-like domain-containing protein [Candidatus Limnocylindrales bacterium]|nr:GyrI-like domain-containing protein [Candidatus Limnocylindrales bacterium]